MPIDLVRRVAEQCHELDVSQILLSGGEAMQHPEWPQIGRIFRDAGVRVMLLTNGLLLRKQAVQLAENIDEVIVSLDGGTARTYERIRGVDAFDLLLEGIDAVHAQGLPVTIRTTVQRANYHEIATIVRIAQQHAVETVSFLAVDVANPFAFGDRTDRQLSDDALDRTEIETLSRIIDAMEHEFADLFASGRIAESPTKLRRILVQYFLSLQGEAPPTRPACNAPRLSAVIGVDGSIQPCYFLPTIGRLTPDAASIGDVINAPAAQALRRAIRSGQRSECENCVCPLHKSARALMRM